MHKKIMIAVGISISVFAMEFDGAGGGGSGGDGGWHPGGREVRLPLPRGGRGRGPMGGRGLAHSPPAVGVGSLYARVMDVVVAQGSDLRVGDFEGLWDLILERQDVIAFSAAFDPLIGESVNPFIREEAADAGLVAANEARLLVMRELYVRAFDARAHRILAYMEASVAWMFSGRLTAESLVASLEMADGYEGEQFNARRLLRLFLRQHPEDVRDEAEALIAAFFGSDVRSELSDARFRALCFAYRFGSGELRMILLRVAVDRQQAVLFRSLLDEDTPADMPGPIYSEQVLRAIRGNWLEGVVQMAEVAGGIDRLEDVQGRVIGRVMRHIIWEPETGAGLEAWLRRLVELGFILNHRVESGRLPLEFAGGNEELRALMIELGADESWVGAGEEENPFN